MMNKINHSSKFIKSKYKVAVVGPYAAGKTSLLLRLANGTFDQNYHMTLRPSSYTKSLKIEDSLFVRLELIDTLGSGLSTFGPYSPLRDIDAVLLVYDSTNEQSFLKLADMLSDLKSSLPKEVLFALVGTHLDRPHMREVTPQEAAQLKKQRGLSLFYEVSARTNENMAELFQDLAKYLVIVGASRQKQENPQVSTTYEEQRLTGGRSAKCTVLQKKLAYKQEECRKLWKDLQEAFERIANLESRTKDDSSYILNYAGDTEELEQKIHCLQQQIQEVKKSGSAQKVLLESKYSSVISNYQRKVQELSEQRDKLTSDLQKLSQELADIEEIILEHQHSSALMIQQKNAQIQKLVAEIEHLNHEKHSLTQLMMNQIEQKTKERIVFAELQTKLLEQIQQKNGKIRQLQAEAKKLLFQKQESDSLIDLYQQRVVTFREQMIEMQYLQEELAIQHQKFYRMQITYQDNINKMKKQYEARVEVLVQEKELILKGKQKVVSKIIQNKVNEIKLIRSFIDQIDSKKDAPSKKPLEGESQQQFNDGKIKAFFNQFIQLIQENSQYLHYNLQTLLGSLQTMETDCTELLEDTAKLDLSEVWYDLKERQENSYLSAYIQKPQAHQIWCILNLQTQKRVSKCISALEQMMGKMRSATEDLRENMMHVSESLNKIDRLRQVGVQAYLESLND